MAGAELHNFHVLGAMQSTFSATAAFHVCITRPRDRMRRNEARELERVCSFIVERIPFDNLYPNKLGYLLFPFTSVAVCTSAQRRKSRMTNDGWRKEKGKVRELPGRLGGRVKDLSRDLGMLPPAATEEYSRLPSFVAPQRCPRSTLKHQSCWGARTDDLPGLTISPLPIVFIKEPPAACAEKTHYCSRSDVAISIILLALGISPETVVPIS